MAAPASAAATLSQAGSTGLAAPTVAAMADGWIVVTTGPQGIVVREQVVAPDRETAVTARDRANTRAELSGREPAYQLAEISVEQPLPTAEKIVTWLQRAGWKQTSVGIGGSMWMSPSGRKVAVPAGDEDGFFTRGALQRIAADSGMKMVQLLVEIDLGRIPG